MTSNDPETPIPTEPERPTEGVEPVVEPTTDVPATEPEPEPVAPAEPQVPAEPEIPPAPATISFPRLDVLGPDEFDDEDEDDYEDEEYGEDDPDEPRSIVITGANGNIGRKLREAWSDLYDLVLIDKEADPDDQEVIVADLSVYDEEWAQYFVGVDTVIHLAANPSEHATWEELTGPNMDALANVFNAAVVAGVDRIVFASSNHAMGGYKNMGDMPITEDLTPRPGNAYGATKLMGERLGQSLSKAFDLTFVALRIGWVQSGANHPSTLPDDWSRLLWLSDNDMLQLFECAVEADLGEETFVVINGMSNNEGTRWDLSRGFDVLGYSPEDDVFAEEL